MSDDVRSIGELGRNLDTFRAEVIARLDAIAANTVARETFKIVTDSMKDDIKTLQQEAITDRRDRVAATRWAIGVGLTALGLVLTAIGVFVTYLPSLVGK